MFHIDGIRISHLLSVIPKYSKSLDEEIQLYNYPEKRTKKLSINMGYGNHRIIEDGVTAVDMAYYGVTYLIDKGLLDSSQIDAIVFVTVTQDHMIPGNSSILHGRLGLKNNVYCTDINQACSGYITGLIHSCSLLKTSNIKKVLLITGDTLSKKVSKYDKFSWLLIGDGVSITIIEHGSDVLDASFYTDGTNYDSLYIPAGGLRLPSTDKTRALQEEEDNNFRSKENLFIDGLNVYNFSLEIIPKEITQLLKQYNCKIDDIDLFCFHQPNKFVLDKIAEKLQIDYEKMPSNISTLFGNISSATIPTVITYNIGDKLIHQKLKICMAGFGAGLISAVAIMDIGNLNFCNIVEYEKKI